MSESTTSQIVIDASPEQVLAVISSLEEYPSWTEGMKNVTINARDARGRALEATFVVASGPINDAVTLAYTWHESSLAWHLVSGSTLTKLDGSYAWQQVGDHTEVTYQLSVDLSIGLPGIFRRAAEKQIVSTALQGLKKKVESTS